MFQIAMILGKKQKVAAFTFYGELKTRVGYFEGIRDNAESMQVQYFILYIQCFSVTGEDYLIYKNLLEYHGGSLMPQGFNNLTSVLLALRRPICHY